MVEQSEFPNLPPFNEQEDKIYLKDFDLEQNEHFIKFVFIPYFKDIYNDLADKSENKEKGINKIVFTEYANLPGILSERFFKIIDENGDGFIDQKEFIHAMFKVYYSKLESKIKLVFDIYDFDADGYISKEDIRIVLSHVPISHVNKVLHKDQVKEGKITQEGGGFIDYQDRIQVQSEILQFIDNSFNFLGGKSFLDLNQFTKIQEDYSSEMLLTIMSLMQDNMPCSENFFRFQKNYDTIVEKNAKDSNSPIQETKSRKIASPKLMHRLSPISNILNKSNELKKRNLNIDTDSQKQLLKYAANIDNIEKLREFRNEKPKENKDNDQEVEKVTESIQAFTLEEPEIVINQIPISKFKPNQIQMMEGKLRREGSEKESDKEEAKERSPVRYQEAIRLPNYGTLKSALEISGKLPTVNDGFSSPTNFLMNESYAVLDNFMSAAAIDNYEQYEGEILRKAPQGRYKRYWFCLLGKELYCYKKKDEQKHKGMHNLIGAYVKEEPEEKLPDGVNSIFPFKLIFPPTKSRTYYLMSQAERDQWVKVIKAAIGYANIEDFYDIKEDIGQGKFGLVKVAVHKKTGKKVAVKAIKKKEMKQNDQELQKIEIDILKICQHPNIIRLLDVFENPEYIYIVMEYMQGGDLFNYLEKRDFKITEDRARHIVHQIASALYYLHSYGIVHRDIKLENIMMVNQSNDSDLKIVDFGLSKILGPNESSTEPFGTLSYVAPEVLLQRPYGRNVDLWSLGVIVYVLLSAMLPFDAEDQKQAARKIIYEPVPFNHPIWDFVSLEAKDLIKRLLEKDRFNRISLDEVLTHPWICKRSQHMQEMRRKSGDLEKFILYTATNPDQLPPEFQIK